MEIRKPIVNCKFTSLDDIKNKRSIFLFSSFCNMVDYKSKWYGRTYIKVGSFYPSSKLCNCCGYKNTTLTLADREWECPNCHTLLDRDKNAALNILDEGLKILNKINKSGRELPIEPIDTGCNNNLE